MAVPCNPTDLCLEPMYTESSNGLEIYIPTHVTSLCMRQYTAKTITVLHAYKCTHEENADEPSTRIWHSSFNEVVDGSYRLQGAVTTIFLVCKPIMQLVVIIVTRPKQSDLLLIAAGLASCPSKARFSCLFFAQLMHWMMPFAAVPAKPKA